MSFASAWEDRETHNLDFLRTVAVLCVVARHISSVFGDPVANAFFQPQALGIFGVLLFFVHTSLVLMMSLRRHGGDFRALYASFAVRRAFRIYPLAIAVILIDWFLLPSAASDMDGIRAAGVANAHVLLGNLGLVQNLVHVPYVNGVLWTLPLELQMYVLLPFLFLLARHDLVSGSGLVKWALLPVSLLMAAVQVKLRAPALDVLKFAPCFVSGVLCWSTPLRRVRLPFWVLPAGLLGLSMYYSGAYAVVQHRPGAHVGAGETPLGWPLCIALGILLPQIVEMRWEFLKAVSKTVAQYSYGVYLCHIPCIWLGFRYFRGEPLAVRFGICAVTLALSSIAAYHLVERPLINVGSRLADRLGRRPAHQAEPAVAEPDVASPRVAEV